MGMSKDQQSFRNMSLSFRGTERQPPSALQMALRFSQLSLTAKPAVSVATPKPDSRRWSSSSTRALVCTSSIRSMPRRNAPSSTWLLAPPRCLRVQKCWAGKPFQTVGLGSPFKMWIYTNHFFIFPRRPESWCRNIWLSPNGVKAPSPRSSWRGWDGCWGHVQRTFRMLWLSHLQSPMWPKQCWWNSMWKSSCRTHEGWEVPQGDWHALALKISRRWWTMRASFLIFGKQPRLPLLTPRWTKSWWKPSWPGYLLLCLCVLMMFMCMLYIYIYIIL